MKEILLIGSYTESRHREDLGRGIYQCDLDGPLVAPPRAVVELRNPSYLTANKNHSAIYSVNETKDFMGVAGGGVTALRWDRDGRLEVVGSAPTGGDEPCHLALNEAEDLLAVANYGSGSVSLFPTNSDGLLGARQELLEFYGSSSIAERQASSHIHMVIFDSSHGDLFSTDLGCDVVRHHAAVRDGVAATTTTVAFRAHPGAGPRHLAFHPNGKHAFLINELDQTLVVLRREGINFVALSAVSVSRDSHSIGMPAAVRVTPSGNTVLVSIRGEGNGTILLFRFHIGTSSLSLEGSCASGGLTPRDMVLGRNGNLLFVANQDSDLVTTFEFDESNIKLHCLSDTKIPAPACLLTTNR